MRFISEIRDMCMSRWREVPAACPSEETWDIARGVQHLGILGESVGKPQPQNPGYRATSHLLMRCSQIADGSLTSMDQGSCGLCSLVGICCVGQRCAGRGTWRSTCVPISDTAVTQENQLEHGCSQFSFKEQAGHHESRDPRQLCIRIRLQQQGWDQGHC